MSTFQKTIIALLSLLIIAVLAIVGRYFLVILPAEQQAERDLKNREIFIKEQELEAKQRKEQAEMLDKLDQENKELERENNYSSCLNSANATYSQNRKEACAEQAEEDYQKYIKCLGNDNDETNPYCKTLIDVKKGDASCTLPYYNSKGSILNAQLENMKKQCNELYGR